MTSFIAEISSNHNRDLDRACRMIQAAAAAGCAAVKFQLFKIDELFAPEVFKAYPGHLKRKEWELPVDFLPTLAGETRRHGMQFMCTPFYLKAVEELEPFVDAYKIASYELLWHDLLQACARTGKPMIVSTGMADLAEVQSAVAAMREAGCRDLSLLHCVSNYPASPEDCNLSVIETLRRECGVPVGWSDHSVNAGVILRAIFKYGADPIEFHFDLDGAGEEFAGGHCWLPDQIREVILQARAGCGADGDGRKVHAESEAHERNWRADPADGLRPFRFVRAGLAKKES